MIDFAAIVFVALYAVLCLLQWSTGDYPFEGSKKEKP